jgi:hypothetical protein
MHLLLVSDIQAYTVTTLLVITVRAVSLTSLDRPFMTSIINATQTVNLGVSLLTNLIATSIITVKAW